MTVLSINGVSVEPTTDLTTLTNGELSMLLGENGTPKYSAGQLKNKTKASLADEARDVVNAAAKTAKPKRDRRTKNEVAQDRHKPAKNLKSAQSKWCNLLKALVAGKKTEEQVEEIIAADPIVSELRDKNPNAIDNALKGIRPGQAKNVKIVEVELDENEAGA